MCSVKPHPVMPENKNLSPKPWRNLMAGETKPEEGPSGLPNLIWVIILGVALLFFVVVGFTSDKSIHGVLMKKSRSSEAIQATSSPHKHGSPQYH